MRFRGGIVVVIVSSILCSGWAGANSQPAIVASTPDTFSLRRTLSPNELEGGIALPLDPEVGIGPGSMLRIEIDGLHFGCTANFVWADALDDLYLGTAGHCLLPDGTNATHGPDADYDASNVTVSAAAQGCRLAPSTFVLAVVDCLEGTPPQLVSPQWVPLGEVVYARQEPIGTDFGLVRLPDAVLPIVRFELPYWGGPNGTADAVMGDRLLHYGHGLGYDAAPALRRRAAIANEAFEAVYPDAMGMVGLVNSGDSGSAVVRGVESDDGTVPRGGEAVGVITHRLGPVFAGHALGTSVARAQRDVECYVGLAVRVIPGGEMPPSQHTPPCPMPPCEVDCGGLVALAPVDALAFAVQAGRVHELEIESAGAFRVTQFSSAAASFGQRVLALLYPRAALEASLPACAALPDTWTQILVPGGNNRRMEGPLHPAGNYTLLVASPIDADIEIEFNDAPDAVDLDDLARRVVEANISGKSAMFLSVAEFDSNGAAPFTTSFKEAVVAPRVGLAVGDFEVLRDASAGAYSIDVSLEHEGATCARSAEDGVGFSAPMTGWVAHVVGSAFLPEGGFEFRGTHEITAGADVDVQLVEEARADMVAIFLP